MFEFLMMQPMWPFSLGLALLISVLLTEALMRWANGALPEDEPDGYQRTGWLLFDRTMLWLGVGSLPMVLIWTAVLLPYVLIGFSGQCLFIWLTGRAVPFWLAGVTTLVPALVLGGPLARLLNRLLARP
ncbi:MAG: hypothetical protein ACFB22_13475 [Rhodothalassiaceae bacterium]